MMSRFAPGRPALNRYAFPSRLSTLFGIVPLLPLPTGHTCARACARARARVYIFENRDKSGTIANFAAFFGVKVYRFVRDMSGTTGQKAGHFRALTAYIRFTAREAHQIVTHLIARRPTK